MLLTRAFITAAEGQKLGMFFNDRIFLFFRRFFPKGWSFSCLLELQDLKGFFKTGLEYRALAFSHFYFVSCLLEQLYEVTESRVFLERR